MNARLQQAHLRFPGWEYSDAGDDGEDEDSECTPPELVDMIRDFYGGTIDLDPCSNRHSQVGALVQWRKSDDGLSKPWSGRIAGVELRDRYVNPPYSKPRPWLERCTIERAKHPDTNTIALVKCDVSTIWWNLHCWHADAIGFVDKRIPFLHPTRIGRHGAKFPNALVYWGPHAEGFKEFFAPIAHTVLCEHVTRGEHSL